MTATNHALTGAIIGLSVHNPWLAIPAAVASHLICDALPHFGSADKDIIKKRQFMNYLFAEATLCALLVFVLLLVHPAYWILGAVCAFAATSPDFISIRRFIAIRSGKVFHPSALERFLKNIQWFERPIGAAVETVWLCGCLVILSAII